LKDAFIIQNLLKNNIKLYEAHDQKAIYEDKQ